MPAHALGESCLLWQLENGATHANARRVHRLYQQLNHALAAGRIAFHDAVPGYDSLAVHFDPLTTDVAALQKAVETLLTTGNTDAPAGHDPATDDPAPTRIITLPVVYDGPDLPHVAQHTRMPAAQVIHRHAAPTYVVAAIGFLPHFPYLLGLAPALSTPRRAAPRPRVPAGAVAIGHDQTGVYPCESPGGWNLIGTTDPARLIALRPGDGVRFEVTP